MELDCLHGVPLVQAAAHQVPREALLLQQSAPPHIRAVNETSRCFHDTSPDVSELAVSVPAVRVRAEGEQAAAGLARVDTGHPHPLHSLRGLLQQDSIHHVSCYCYPADLEPGGLGDAACAPAVARV